MYFLIKISALLFKLIKIFIINFLILYLLLLIIEISFQIKNKSFLSESKFIYRDKIQNEYENEVHLSYVPYKLIHSNTDLFPLSGISNVRTIFCQEKDKFYEYYSDKYGFNSGNNQESSKILLIGDSYVQGMCVEPSLSFASMLNSINMGFFGNGPLIEYATFKEYGDSYEFKYLVWVFTPDNDFYDFSQEIQNETLKKYISDDNFSQNLVEKNNMKDEIILNYFDYESRILKEKIKYYHLDIKYVRKTIAEFVKSISKEEVENNENISSNMYSEKNLNLIADLFINVNQVLLKKDVKFLVVFNAFHPGYKYSKSFNFMEHYKLMSKNKKQLKDILTNSNIEIYDFDEYIHQNYDEKNIDKIFKKVGNSYDHYSIFGNKVLSEEILKALKI